jgi:hypothetical protein
MTDGEQTSSLRFAGAAGQANAVQIESPFGRED